MGVTEAAYAAHGAEVVVEGAVLLHQDDDVLDVLDRAGPVVRRDGERLAEVQRERRADRGNSHRLEERTAIHGAHNSAFVRPGRETGDRTLPTTG
jgi:hypothetical protein